MVTATKTMSVVIEDPTGQIRRRASGIHLDATVGEVMTGLMSELKLPANDSQGRPLTYAARAHGESLLESDRIGEVLKEGDTVTLSQNVTAG